METEDNRTRLFLPQKRFQQVARRVKSVSIDSCDDRHPVLQDHTFLSTEPTF